jgi:hypothetical protein
MMFILAFFTSHAFASETFQMDFSSETSNTVVDTNEAIMHDCPR